MDELNYVLKQKNQYWELINNEQNFEKAFQVALKKNDLDIFEVLLRNTSMQGAFANEIFEKLINNVEVDNKEKLVEFANKMGISELKYRYGEKNGAVKDIEEKLNSEEINCSDLGEYLKLKTELNVNKKRTLLSDEELEQIREEEGNKFQKLYDLFSNNDIQFGVCRTGSERFTEGIEKNGLELLDHKLGEEFHNYENINCMDVMKKNIEFFKKPSEGMHLILESIADINREKVDDTDMIIIGIPQEQIDENTKVDSNQDIIINNEDKTGKVINPKYIAGHIKVNIQTAQIDSVNENPFVENELWNSNLSNKDNVMKQLEKCYEYAEKSENVNLVQKTMNIFKNMVKGIHKDTIKVNPDSEKNNIRFER